MRDGLQLALALDHVPSPTAQARTGCAEGEGTWPRTMASCRPSLSSTCPTSLTCTHLLPLKSLSPGCCMGSPFTTVKAAALAVALAWCVSRTLVGRWWCWASFLHVPHLATCTCYTWLNRTPVTAHSVHPHALCSFTLRAPTQPQPTNDVTLTCIVTAHALAVQVHSYVLVHALSSRSPHPATQR